MNISDYIALIALLLGIVSALAAFIYWLVSMSYKISRFIYELRADVTEIKHTIHDYENDLTVLGKQVKYLTYIFKKEFPQYLRRESDNDSNDQESFQA